MSTPPGRAGHADLLRSLATPPRESLESGDVGSRDGVRELLKPVLGIDGVLGRLAAQVIAERGERLLLGGPGRLLRREHLPAGVADPGRSAAQEILDRLLFTGRARLPPPADLYAALARAVYAALRDHARTPPPAAASPQTGSPQAPSSVGDTVRDTGLARTYKLPSADSPGEHWFLSAAAHLDALIQQNCSGYADPYLLYYFAGRTAVEIALLLDQDPASVKERVEFIEFELLPDGQEAQEFQPR